VYRSLASRSFTRTTPSFSNSQRNFRIDTPPRALLSAPAQESDSTVTVAAVPPDGAGSSTTHRMVELAFRTAVCGE
jgi:ABC-type transport system involved in Fe-S cluster assembly fused permease/ATPase subunit